MSARTSAQPWLGIRLLMADEPVPGPMGAQPVAPRLGATTMRKSKYTLCLLLGLVGLPPVRRWMIGAKDRTQDGVFHRTD